MHQNLTPERRSAMLAQRIDEINATYLAILRGWGGAGEFLKALDRLLAILDAEINLELQRVDQGGGGHVAC